MAYTLADQPLAETGQGAGGAVRGVGGAGALSAASSVRGAPTNGAGSPFGGPSSGFTGRPSFGDVAYGSSGPAQLTPTHENGTWDRNVMPNGIIPGHASTSNSGFTRRGEFDGTNQSNGHSHSASQEYMRAYKAQSQQNDLPKETSAGMLVDSMGSGLLPSTKDSYPMQTMNESGNGTAF